MLPGEAQSPCQRQIGVFKGPSNSALGVGSGGVAES